VRERIEKVAKQIINSDLGVKTVSRKLENLLNEALELAARESEKSVTRYNGLQIAAAIRKLKVE